MAESEFTRGDYTISTDKARLDVPLVHHYLSERAYWALGRSLSIVRLSIENSLCYGVYAGSKQAGFARVVTDTATFAWLCDVFILEEYRGRGLGKWLVECIVSNPELSKLRLFILATRDAHSLYRQYGKFEPLQEPQRWLARWSS